VNWIAVEESGGMTRWINLDNVTEVRSVSEAQITDYSKDIHHGGPVGNATPHHHASGGSSCKVPGSVGCADGRVSLGERPGLIRPRLSIVGAGTFCVSYVQVEVVYISNGMCRRGRRTR
jgi:hypothetical protein